jgi:shikimate dehydrogenase
MKKLSRMMIDQHTKLYGVLGYPVAHSLSPLIQNSAFSAKGVNAVYLAFETKDITGCLEGMRSLDIKGMSVTIPYKSSVLPLLDEIDVLAEKIGAANTIVNDNGRLIGYNTDAVGALRALEEKIDLQDKTGLIIGAGGAARAIGFILKENGVSISIVNRSEERGKDLAHALDCPFVPLENIKSEEADILVQTTSVGMHPHNDQCIVPESVLKKEMAVMDVIYNPIETRLLKMAGEKGCLTINGLGMFVQQGAEQFRLWTGLEPPIIIMTRVAIQALQQ